MTTAELDIKESRAILEEYLKILGPLQLDNVNGHSYGLEDERIQRRFLESVARGLWWEAFEKGDARMIVTENSTRKVIERLKAGETVRLGVFEGPVCWNCGEKGHTGVIKGATIYVSQYDFSNGAGVNAKKIPLPACPIDPTKPYAVEINVPSGVMVVANHFSQLFKEREDRYAQENCINYLNGRKRMTEWYATQGYIEMNLGNCSIRMFKLADDKFVVGDMYDDAEPGPLVARVIADFWGYGVTDLDLAIKNGLEAFEKKHEFMDITRVLCAPGRYRFSHRYHLAISDGPEIYTNIDRIGPCT